MTNNLTKTQNALASEPLVSIVMPAFNASNHIGSAIQSALNQSYRNLELIIIDDGSTDSTPSIISAFSSTDNRVIHLTLERNSGVACARNRGIAHAKGEYISFLDADDLWYSPKLTEQVKFMTENQKLCCNTFYLRIKDSKYNRVVSSPLTLTYKDLLKSNHIANSTAIYNSKVLGKFYQESIGHEDYLMWLNILKTTDAACLPKVMVEYRVGSSSLSSNLLQGAIWHWRILVEQECLSFTKKIIYMGSYLYFALSKRISIKNCKQCIKH